MMLYLPGVHSCVHFFPAVGAYRHLQSHQRAVFDLCDLQGVEFLSLQNVGCSVHACKAVEELLPPNSKLAGLHLFNNMSGDEGAGHIARLLSRCPMADFRMASSRVGPAGGISIAKALMNGEAISLGFDDTC